MSSKCYMCADRATSREHVPPKCIFPERKDYTQRNLRKDLITVPSCDLHNSCKSKDDEFLMVSLAGIIGNNSIGYRQKFSKVNRAIVRSANRLLDNVFLKREHFVVKMENNDFVEVIWGTPNYARLEKCFEHVARGVYFHHAGVRFEGTLKTVLGHLYQHDSNARNFVELIRHKAERDLRGCQQYGSNPEVFFYQFSEKDEHGLFLLRMCFYGGIDIFVAFTARGIVPTPNLAMMLIEGGIKTFVKDGEKTFEFN